MICGNQVYRLCPRERGAQEMEENTSFMLYKVKVVACVRDKSFEYLV